MTRAGRRGGDRALAPPGRNIFAANMTITRNFILSVLAAAAAASPAAARPAADAKARAAGRQAGARSAPLRLRGRAEREKAAPGIPARPCFRACRAPAQR
jgi:hypothetical protein